MKIVVDKKKFQKRLSELNAIANADLFILNEQFMYWIGQNIGYLGYIDFDKVEETGTICIPLKNLLEIVKEMKGMITIETKDNHYVTVSSDIGSVRLAQLPVEDYPKLPSIENSIEIETTIHDLKSMIDLTYYATNKNHSQRELANLLFKLESPNLLTVVGTDSYRLALIKKIVNTHNQEMDILIPLESIIKLKRLLSSSPDKARILIGEQNIMFILNNTTFYTNRSDEIFPNYQMVIPSSFKYCVSVNKNKMIYGLKLISKTLPKDNNVIKLKFTNKSMVISSEDEKNSNQIMNSYEGESFSIKFNAKYLIDAISSTHSNSVMLKFVDVNKPLMIDEGNYMTLLMPIGG